MEINLMRDGLVAGSKFSYLKEFYKPVAMIAAGFFISAKLVNGKKFF
jgi:hypothetical protein